MELAPLTRIGSFEIVSLLGKGGMGAVYRARDLDLGRDVAIKVLRDDLTSDPSRIERFQREARSASGLNHPNIITIHEIGLHEGVQYLVMEHVAGVTLRDKLDDGPLEVQDLLRVSAQIAEGLAKAHGEGIVHRDLKPENLMITEEGLVKILDFGLVKLTGASESGADSPTLERQITETGIIIGTVAYMSPEQLAGVGVDGRSDQFSLGTILYEMATGKRPFERPSMPQRIAAIMEATPEPISLHRMVPEPLESLVTRLLSKDPSERFGSTAEVAKKLRSLHNRALMVTTEQSSSDVASATTALPSFLHDAHDRDERSRPLFVGREAESRALLEKLDKALDGEGQLVFITGEPGSGKTSLMQELAVRAQQVHEELVVAVGHCNAQTGSGDPYLPIRELIDLLTGDVQARREARAMQREDALRLWQLLPAALKALVTESPELIGTLVNGPALLSRVTPSGVAAAEAEGLRELVGRKQREGDRGNVQQAVLLDQFAQFINAVSRRRPLLLMFEDIHWADAGTIAMLCHLCERIGGYRIMLAASYRPADLVGPNGTSPHPLEAARHRLRQKYGDFEVRVGEKDGREFIDALVDTSANDFDEDFREAMFRQTKGHPLFAVELMRDLRERGMLVEGEDGVETVAQAIDWDALPARVEAMIAERIGRLPDSLKRVLTLGAVQGEDLTAEVIAKIEGMDEREIIRLLSDEADKKHQLVRALDTRRSGSQRLSVYRFRHILFQKYLYQSLDRVERSYLHEETGATLESLLGDKAEDASVQLARHFEHAGLLAKASFYLSISGDKARRAYASQEAMAYYNDAIASHRQSDEAATGERNEQLMRTFEGRGRVSMSLTRFDDAIADFGEMRRLAHDAGDVHNEAEALCQLAYCHFLKMDDDQIPVMEAFAQEALDLTKDTGDQNILSRGLTTLGIVHETRGQLPEAIEKLERSTDICRREGYHHALVQNLFHLGQQAYWQGDFAKAKRIGEEGVDVSAEIRDSFQEHFNRAVVCLSTWGAGRYREAFALVASGIEKARAIENRFIEGRLCNSLGWFHRDLGDFYGAIELHENGLALAKAAGVLNVEVSALIDLGHDYFALGQLDRARSLIEPTLERVDKEGIGSHRWRWMVRLLNMLAEVHFAAGRFEDAQRICDQAMERANETSSAKYIVAGHALEARLAQQHGDVAAAGECWKRAHARAESLASPTIGFPVASRLSAWCTDNGEESRAAELAARAESDVEAIADDIDNETLKRIFLRSKPAVEVMER